MRILEAAILLANAPLVAWYLTHRSLPGRVRWLPAATLVLSVIQVLVEGWRWQMAPAYLASGWFCLIYARPRLAIAAPWSGLIGLVCLVGSASLATILPVFALPTPTGRFPVGTQGRHLVDPAREETHGGSTGRRREMMVQFWYPADPDRSGPKDIYRPRAETSIKSRHFSLVRTHSAVGVPVAVGPSGHPVIIYCPSVNGRRRENTALAENLASHGFIVAAIDHPYAADLTIFPDGRTVRSSLKFLDPSSDEAFAESKRILEDELKIRVADVRFVLDTLERLNRRDPEGLFTGRIDLGLVGILGYSFGGAVASEAVLLEPRIKVGANLDGLIFGESAASGVDSPFLFMTNESPFPPAPDPASPNGSLRRMHALETPILTRSRDSLERHGGYWIGIQGVSHANFNDSPHYSPIRRLSGSGPIGASRGAKLVGEYVLAFFNRHLNRTREPLLDGRSPGYPEVQFRAGPHPDE